jgi:hypothetical protein
MLWVPTPEPSQKGASCVVDVGLSLAPTGLYWVLGLARAVPVYLPQCHFAIIDDKEFPIDERLATHLSGAPDFTDAVAILARVRHDWREARDRIGFESYPNLYWPMDGRSDSVLPKDGDTSLVDRLHILAAGLDNRIQERSNEKLASADALSDCARDTLALAAAFRDRRPIILAPLPDEGGEPLIAAHLARASIPCSQVTRSRFTEAVGSMLVPAMLASGLAVRLASRRLRLAGLFVVAPGALAASVMAEHLAEGDDDLCWDPTSNGNEAACWDDATAVWWEWELA